MHIAQRKELDVHKTKQKRDRNRTTTSLVLYSRMQRGRWEFPLNQRIWLRLSSVFESRQISFFKIFLVTKCCIVGCSIQNICAITTQIESSICKLVEQKSKKRENHHFWQFSKYVDFSCKTEHDMLENSEFRRFCNDFTA